MQRSPDYVELVAEKYLKSATSLEVEFEPNGPQTFPDFSVGTQVYAEVTRLELPLEDGRSFTEHSAPFIQSVENFLEKSSIKPRGNHDYFVCFSVKFPLNINDELIKLKNAIFSHSKLGCETAEDSDFAGVHRIKFLEGNLSANPRYRLGLYTPTDLSGWVGNHLAKSITEALKRKSSDKFKSKKANKEFWLLVGDAFSYRIDPSLMTALERVVSENSLWDRVVLLNPRNLDKSTVIKNSL